MVDYRDTNFVKGADSLVKYYTNTFTEFYPDPAEEIYTNVLGYLCSLQVFEHYWIRGSVRVSYSIFPTQDSFERILNDIIFEKWFPAISSHS